MAWVSQTQLGSYYLNKLNRKQALKWLKKAANKNEPSATTGLGYLAFLDGDIDSAINYYEKAIKLGCLEASFQMGLLYFSGDGVPKNDKKAYQYYQDSANKGFPEAIYMQAWCLEQGVGTKQNMQKALELREKAAQFGFSDTGDLSR